VNEKLFSLGMVLGAPIGFILGYHVLGELVKDSWKVKLFFVVMLGFGLLVCYALDPDFSNLIFW